MCRLFESIRLENGVLCNPGLHEARMTRSLHALFGLRIHHDLHRLEIPDHCREGVFKCRVVYRHDIESVEFIPYRQRTINSAKLVIIGELDYAHKYLDREAFNTLLSLHEDVDELLLVKQGLITDSTYSNLAFFNGTDWFTPATPLLAGTRRQLLLGNGRVKARDIFPADLQQFSHVSFFNAMNDLGQVVCSVKNIMQT